MYKNGSGCTPQKKGLPKAKTWTSVSPCHTSRDESSSGANLTTANHAIFVHPLLTSSQYEYEVRRCRLTRV